LAKLLIKEHRKVSQKGGGIAPRIVIAWNCATATAINLNVELSIKLSAELLQRVQLPVSHLQDPRKTRLHTSIQLTALATFSS